MGFHHIAFACRDSAATHRFYTEVMGFELVKVHVSPTPGDHGGWSKHFFYSTDGSGAASADNGMIAFWELHDDKIGSEFGTNLNKSAGLPGWVNHFAFDAASREDLDRHLTRWREHGHTVLEIDHEFCVSIYTRDPDGNMVEFCLTTRDFTPEERSSAQRLVLDPQPPFDPGEPQVTVHQPLARVGAS